MRYWHSLGWRELQLFAQEHDHKPVEATCKRSTVRDFVWCSPELLHYLESTAVLHDCFPDHSAVCGFFRFPDTVPVLPYWPSPNPIPWDSVGLSSWHCAIDASWTSFPWGLCPLVCFRRKIIDWICPHTTGSSSTRVWWQGTTLAAQGWRCQPSSHQSCLTW